MRLLDPLLLGVLVVGCASDEGSRAPVAPAPFDAPEKPVPAATPVPTPTPVTYPRPCADVYDPARLPEFRLEIDPALWEQMHVEYYQKIENWYGPVTIRYEDEVRTDVWLRNRGNNSRCGEKIQVTFAFNKVNSDRRFHGLRRVNLDHGGWGCKSLEERVALAWMREDLGLPTPCANHARLVVNGEYYGLYTNLEHIDREFLERNFPDPDGNLYKDGWKKQTNESDPDHSDIGEFWAASTAEELEEVADIEQMMLGWAAEAAIPARDNFWIYGWNYHVYNDPDRGFVFIPTDMDQALPAPDSVEFEPLPAREAPADWLLADPGWRDDWPDVFGGVLAAFDDETFAARIDEYWAQVGPSAEEDPFLGWNAESDRFAGLKDRYRLRREFLEEWLSCTNDPAACPPEPTPTPTPSPSPTPTPSP